jgi:hypothetical protein
MIRVLAGTVPACQRDPSARTHDPRRGPAGAVERLVSSPAASDAGPTDTWCGRHCPSDHAVLMRRGNRPRIAAAQARLRWRRACYGSSMARSLARLALPTLALALALQPGDVVAQYRYLCTSIPSACTYTGPDAPALKENVCYGSTTGIRLMSGSSCPSGSWPYFVEYGEVVDPLTNQVAAYIPLDDACAQPGLCVAGPPPPGAQEFPMCCTGNTSGGDQTCVNGTSCGGTLWFCFDGVCNEDGTVTCFHAIEGVP